MQNYNSKFKTNLNDRCFQLSLKIIALADELPKKRSAWIISDQVIRSIMIASGILKLKNQKF